MVAGGLVFGHLINQDGILVDSDKIKAVIRWEFMMSLIEIQSFPRLAGYYRTFIGYLSKIVVPLTRLTKKDGTFCWGPE